MNSFTKRVLQIKQKTPKNRNSASTQCFMGFVFHYATNDNIATLNDIFCLSCTSCSTYLSRSASLRTKVQGEWGV